MEVPGWNSGKLFFDIFCAHLLPHGDYSIRVSRSHDFTLVVWFLVYNFVAVSLLPFLPSKGTAAIISLCTHEFSSYSHTQFTL